jgi:hypothetical protein
MSFAEGLLGGMATGMNRQRDKKDRARELSAMEALAERPLASAGSGGDAAFATGAGAGGFTYDGKIGDRATYAFDYFRNAGLPDHVAAGLVGNLMQESGTDINPAAVGDNGNAFGSGQWNGDRRHAYLGYAKAKGVDYTDYDTQLEFLLHEGKTTEKSAWAKILATTTPEEAAAVASAAFWRPGTPHTERRTAYATTIFNNRRPAPATAAATPKGGEWFRGFFKE